MSSFKLLNDKSVERALLALFSEMARDGVLKDFPAVAARHAANPVKVELPGFNLFTSSAKVKPYTWMVAKPKADIQEFLRAYENLASQPITRDESVAEKACRVYKRDSDERRVFMKFSRDEMWLSAALLFAASAQYLGAEIEKSTPTSVRMRLGNGLISIDPWGCWSNARRSVVDSGVDVSLLTDPCTDFKPIVSTNPVITAMYEVAQDSFALPAVTVAAYALEEEIISKALLNKLAKLEGPIVEKAKKVKRDPAKAAAALDQALTVLDSAVYDIVPELFEVVVPDLMSFAKLQAIVGAPSQVREGRIIKESTLNNWKLKIQAEYEELLNAAT